MASMKTMVNALKSDRKVMALFWSLVICIALFAFTLVMLARMFI